MICFPTQPPFNPLRLSSNYRDYFGDSHAKLTALTDQICNAGCYIPRIFHAPDTSAENAGVPANGYIEYALSLPAGSFIIAFMHAFTSQGSLNTTDPPVQSGFRCQITDVKAQYKFFNKPVPEAYFLNDVPSSNASSPFNVDDLYVLNETPRLLPGPYPVVPPGMFKVEFWNLLASTNNLIRLSFLVAVPDVGEGIV
jgi:hypothetical protein